MDTPDFGAIYNQTVQQTANTSGTAIVIGLGILLLIGAVVFSK